MQENLKARRNHLWRKIIAIAFLPIIIFIWTIGWILTQIGSQEEPIKIRQKTLYTSSQFEAYKKDSQISDEGDEDSNAAYEQEIMA